MNDKPSIPRLMKLIANMNGWGDQSSRVSIGYMPARRYNELGENDGIDASNWGWVVSTTICGYDGITVGAQHKKLDGALLALVKAIPEKLVELAQRSISRSNSARTFLSKYAEEVGLDNCAKATKP